METIEYYMYRFFKNAWCKSPNRMEGKIVVITGGNTGIGKETARDLYYRGAKVIMACRHLGKAIEAIKDIKAKKPSKPERGGFDGEPGEVLTVHLDLGVLDSVRKCAATLLKVLPRIDVLINNGAVMYIPPSYTIDGYEESLQVNHLSHFLFTLLLLPIIQKSKAARIITVSSLAHWCALGYIRWDDLNSRKFNSSLYTYWLSKQCNVLFTEELARLFKANNINNINTYTLHPGIIRSDLGRAMDYAFFPGAGFILYLITQKDVEEGAQTSIYCAVEPSLANETGQYYSECRLNKSWFCSEKKAKRMWNESLKMVQKEGENLMAFFEKDITTEDV